MKMRSKKMKLVLTKEELVASAIEYLKAEKIINPEKVYTGQLNEYSSDKYFVVEELKPVAEDEE